MVNKVDGNGAWLGMRVKNTILLLACGSTDVLKKVAQPELSPTWYAGKGGMGRGRLGQGGRNIGVGGRD